MGQYKVCGYNIEFNYNFDDFFKDQINQYQHSFEKADFTMNVLLADEIIPLENPTEVIRNKKIYTYDDEEVMEVYNNSGEVVLLKVKNTFDFQRVEITFAKRLKEKLPEYEYALTGSYFMSFISTKGFLGLHASAINYQNEAILFSAPSGTGKSTQANLWKSIFNNITYINDDKPLIKFEDDQFYVYGSPWSGKNSINTNTKVPLKAIIFLNQHKDNFVADIADNDKIVYLIKNMHRPQDQKTYDLLLEVINLIIKFVPIYIYNCNMEDDAVYTLHKKLYGENQ